MRLVRLGEAGAERPAVLTDGGFLDLSEVVGDIDAAFLSGDGVERARDAAAAGRLPAIGPGRRQRIGPPVARPGKVVCIGLNYADHAAESGQPAPEEPVVFLKAPDTVVGPYDTVLIPRGSAKTDYEVELAVVIGRTARYLADPRQAAGVIAGYCLSNDVSEREFQLERGGQWDKGKSCETFNPLGPYLATPDEVGDPQDLGMALSVNGESRQRGSTANMIFGVYHLVWYLSRFMVLHPGDVINTGTPAGVALGRGEGSYLRDGDVVELSIDRLGTQRLPVAQA